MSRVPRRRFLKTAGASGVLLPFAGCTGGGGDGGDGGDGGSGGGGGSGGSDGGATTTSMSQVEQWASKAQSEEDGQVTVAHFMAGETSDAFFSALEQDIPWLNIEGIKFNSGDLIPRFEAEYNSGNTTIDMIWTSSLSVLSGKGWIVDLSEELPAWSNLPEGSRGQYNVPLRASAHGLLYNTDLMSEDEVPPDRASLTDPQYEGKIVIGQTWSHVLPVFKAVEEANPGWMESMAEQDILWSTHLGTAIKSCAAGQRAMNVPSLPKYQFIEGRAKDTPAKIATQMNPLYMFVYPAGVNQKAPHKNGAMYLANYMATEEGQARLKEAVKTDCAGTSQESLYCDPEEFNDIVKEYDEVEFLSFLTPDEFDTWAEKAQQTFDL